MRMHSNIERKLYKRKLTEFQLGSQSTYKSTGTLDYERQDYRRQIM